MRVFRTACLALLWAAPASANQPPGGQMLLGEIAILPVMMLLTFLGGGYAVMRERKLGPRRRGWLALLAVLTVFGSGMHEGLGMLVLLLFGALAATRGLRLLHWAADSGSRPRQVHPARLRAAGILLILAGIFAAGLGLAFVGWWPDDVYVECDLKLLAAWQMAHAQENTAGGGQPRYLQPALQEGNSRWQLGERFFPFIGPRGRCYDAEFRLGPEGRSYQLWAWPYRMPAFPYNFLVSLPSFYVDQTGQMRQTRVHRAGLRCPPDAPVYYRVTPDDVNAKYP